MKTRKDSVRVMMVCSAVDVASWGEGPQRRPIQAAAAHGESAAQDDLFEDQRDEGYNPERGAI